MPIDEHGKCMRCHENFGEREDDKCQECGVHEDRPVRRIRRSSPVGGKRGRNSGTTNKSKA